MVRDLADDISGRQHYILPVHQGMPISEFFFEVARVLPWDLYLYGYGHTEVRGAKFSHTRQVPWGDPGIAEVAVFKKSKKMRFVLMRAMSAAGAPPGTWTGKDEKDILLPKIESWAMLEARFMFPTLFVDAINVDSRESAFADGMPAEEYLAGMDERMASVKWEVPSPEGG